MYIYIYIYTYIYTYTYSQFIQYVKIRFLYLFILGTSPLPGEAPLHWSLRGFGAAGVAHLQLPPGGPGGGCHAA